jgi:hypothetical protein
LEIFINNETTTYSKEDIGNKNNFLEHAYQTYGGPGYEELRSVLESISPSGYSYKSMINGDNLYAVIEEHTFNYINEENAVEKFNDRMNTLFGGNAAYVGVRAVPATNEKKEYATMNEYTFNSGYT